MPKVVIDARSVVAKKSGIGNYVEALIRHMVPLEPALRLLVLRHPSASEPIVTDPAVTELRFPGETKSVDTLLRLGRAHDFADFDLYHAPAEIVPLGIRCPWVVTVHDLMWIEAARLASAFLPVRLVNAIWYRANHARAIGGARRLIAISRATADAIERKYPGAGARTDVVRHGVDHGRFALERSGPRARLDSLVPPGLRYSLIVGQGSPYKNHARMVRAFVEATRDEPDHKLVIVRRFSRIDFEMTRLLDRPRVREKVIVVPAVADDTLVTLYRHATMLLFASLYEGFGLPALEAMASGTPVLGSTTPAVREVVGDAALCAVPDDENDLTRKIRELSCDAELRDRLSAAGRLRARSFTWEQCAKQTLDVYARALAGTGRR